MKLRCRLSSYKVRNCTVRIRMRQKGREVSGVNSHVANKNVCVWMLGGARASQTAANLLFQCVWLNKGYIGGAGRDDCELLTLCVCVSPSLYLYTCV